MKRSAFAVWLVFLIFFVISLVTNILGSIIPNIIEDFNLTLFVGSLVTFSFFIAYGVMSIPAGFFLESAADAGTHGCDYLLTTDMEMEPVPGYDFANWERGYGDVHLVADLSTMRRLSWLEGTALVLCDLLQAHAPLVFPPSVDVQRNFGGHRHYHS